MGAAFGDAIANGIRKGLLINQCMQLKGWTQEQIPQQSTASPERKNELAAYKPSVPPGDVPDTGKEVSSVPQDDTPDPHRYGELVAGVSTIEEAKQKLGPPNSYTDALVPANQLSETCFRQIESNPAYKDISRHIPLNLAKSPSPEQRTDMGIPNDEEVQTLIAIGKDKQVCREQYLEALNNSHPEAVPIVQQLYHDADLISADLIKRKITWGEFNKRIKAVNDDFIGKHKARKLRMGLERGTLLQWITNDPSHIIHVAILFDSNGRMVKVQHVFQK